MSEVGEGQKECPFCAEVIKANAIKCRYCQSDLAARPPEAAETHAPERASTAAKRPRTKKAPCQVCERSISLDGENGRRLVAEHTWATGETCRGSGKPPKVVAKAAKANKTPAARRTSGTSEPTRDAGSARCDWCKRTVPLRYLGSDTRVRVQHQDGLGMTCSGSGTTAKALGAATQAGAKQPAAKPARSAHGAFIHTMTCGTCGYSQDRPGASQGGQVMDPHQSKFVDGDKEPQCPGAGKPPKRVVDKAAKPEGESSAQGLKLLVGVLAAAAAVWLFVSAVSDDTEEQVATSQAEQGEGARDSATRSEPADNTYYASLVDRPKFNVTFDFLKEEYYPGLSTSSKEEMLNAVVSMCNGMTPTTTLADLEAVGEALGVPQQHYRPAILLMNEVCPEYSRQLR